MTTAAFRRDTRRLDRAAATSRRKSWTTAAAIAVVPALLAVLALVSPGVKVAQVDLNDGAVWLTNTNQLKLGRYNSQIGELNAGLVTSDRAFDVLQDGSDVLLTEPGKVSVVDPGAVTLTTQVTLPTGAVVDMAGGVVAVTAPDGMVWVSEADRLDSLVTEDESATFQLGAGAVSAVTTTGEVLSLDPATGEVHAAAFVDGVLELGERDPLTDGVGIVADQVAAVGSRLVVLADDGTLHGQGWTSDLSGYGADLVLQQTGAEHDDVLVAAPSVFLEVPVGGGEPERLQTGGAGTPARPVFLDGCVYGAWASPLGSYYQACDGGEPTLAALDGMSTANRLVFRVNRSIIVLNDILDGRVWLPEDVPQMQEPNWDQIESKEEQQEDDNTSDEVETTQQILAQCAEDSSSPSAQDDEIGVRAGRTAVLSVLGNDSSGECGIIAISEFEQLPETFGVLETVYGGRALQLTVAPGASGTQTFTYTITDGRGTSMPSTATVRLTVSPDGDNAPPVQRNPPTVEVELGASVRVNVMASFSDPDGDDLQLVSGATDGAGTVRVRPDGMLTFIADGEQLGRQVVRVQVSDGLESTEGTLNVDVRPVGSLLPTIEPVHAVAHENELIDVDVLAHVRSASREPVRLAGVEQVEGTEIAADYLEGTFSFQAARVGTYYVPFVVTASPQQASGVARIDVVPWPSEPLPPVAVRDTAMLPLGGEVTIDPLANDYDPNGEVLVLVSAQAGEGSDLQVTVLNHRLLRITATRTLEAAETIEYVVSNGVAEARGEVLVQPTLPSATQRAPVVQDIEVSVRTGGVVTIPVMDFAYDPDSDEMTLQPELVEPVDTGLLFVSGDELRYQAPDEPTTARAVFAIADSAGNVTAARLTVSVHASDPASKQPARPKDLTARVYEGETVRITVPLVGIDDDGDGVALLGQASAPTKGRITAVGADYLEYEALPGEVGTDTFTYAVEDWVGQRSVATIRVGIAPRPTTAQPIVARADEVTVQPGERVEVRVLANDSDPGGGELTLAEQIEVPEGVTASVQGRRIVVQAPDEETVVQIAYTAQNARGGRASAVLTVNVVEGARIASPIAADVIVSPLETLERTSVEVDVLAVAENPSGPLTDLDVSVPASHAAVAQVTASNRILITLGPTAQTIPYRLTNTNPNADGVYAYAFVTVSALGDFPPQLRPKARELRVASGSEIQIDLDEFVQVGPGKSARITDAQRVTATRSDGSELVVDDKTLRFQSADGYAGPASITFEVTDGASRDDEAGRRKTLTLPITVYATDDYPPAFSPSLIDVPQGEAPIVVDLLAMTKGPEGADETAQKYAFQQTSSAPPGFEVTLDGSRLSVAAATSTARGTVGSVGIKIRYGVAGELDARVEFRATASTRPLARVNNVTIPDGESGVPLTVNVLDGAFNPYPETALTVVGATVETPNAGSASVSGSSVVARPLEGFRGQMVVRFWVRDATGDSAREAEGRITVQVRDVPDAPGAPRATEVGDRTARLTWDPPLDTRGAAVTGYEVTRMPGGQTTSCASTTCTLSDLENDREYTFTVRAQNAVGWSAPSPASAPVRPDQVPDAPAAPTVQFGDQELTATWAAPRSPGSAITQYTVEISPAPLSGPATTTTTSTSHTFRNLANGTSYTVRVKAHNRAEGDSGWSPNSAAETPAAVPGEPAVTATRVDTRLGGQIDVTWQAPAENGAAIQSYEIRITGGGETTNVTRDGSDRSYPFAAKNGVNYTFRVAARNKAGVGSAGSAQADTWGTPGAPTGGAAADASGEGASFQGGKVRLSWNRPSETGGVAIDRYEIEGIGGVGTGTTYELSGLTGGVATPQYRVRACNVKGVCGDYGNLPSATPRTVPQSPSISGSGVTWNRFNYQVTPGSDGGSGVLEWRVCVTPQYGSERCSSELRGTDVSGYGSTVVTAQARNATGWSRTASATIEVQRPTAPDRPSVTASATSNPEEITFSWSAPAENGSAITAYRWRIEGVADWHEVGAGVTSVTQPVGRPGDVTVQVQARNDVDWSSSGSARTAATPFTVAPTGVTATPGASAGRMEYSASASGTGGKSPQRFRYRVVNDANGSELRSWQTVNGGSLAASQDGLSPGTTVRLEVQVSLYASGDYWGTMVSATGTVP